MKIAMRFFYYCLGTVCLALGITVTTKLNMGVSPIISVPYTISKLLDTNFANTTMVVYCVFVAVQFILKGKNAKLYDVLQILVTLVFTRFLDLFANIITIQTEALWLKLVLLAVSILLTGAGISFMVNMRLIPNPGDGIVQAISDKIHKDMGFTKNCFDLSCISCSILLGLIFRHQLIGIGIGTVLCVIGVGRAVFFVNWLYKKQMCAHAGVPE